MFQEGLKFLLSCLTRRFVALTLYFGESKKILVKKYKKKVERKLEEENKHRDKSSKSLLTILVTSRKTHHTKCYYCSLYLVLFKK